MVQLLPILISLPLTVLVVEQPVNLSPESGFSRIVRTPSTKRAVHERYRIERRAEEGEGLGIGGMVTDLLGGNSAEASSTRAESGEATKSTQVGPVTFQTTALATPTNGASSSSPASSDDPDSPSSRGPTLSTRTRSSDSLPSSSSVVDVSSSNLISSSSSPPVSEQTLSSATGIVTSALLTTPSPSSPSSLPSSASPSSEKSSKSSDPAPPSETPTSSEEVRTEQAISTANAVTVLSTLSSNSNGGVVTIFSTAGDSSPSASSLNTNAGSSTTFKGGLTSLALAAGTVGGFLVL
ncbi:uncharacterized protein JCM6883_004464 [Sporobolomyces salmoneus]|uniref:uncharacterized protein n=1 Tax=Sporobolomyces salmoneus TaxID=183962 RepID=UPI0031711A3A